MVWRDFGSRDLRASCRKMDQFIFFDDIHEFVNAICRIWGAPGVDFDEVIGWRIPLMIYLG